MPTTTSPIPSFFTMSPPSDYHTSQLPSSPPPRHPHRHTLIFRNALSSTLAASVVATVVTPLDVVKIRLQAHVCPVGGAAPCEDPRHVSSSFDAARKIIRAEGLRGLWRGLNVTLLLAIPTTGLYFTLYEEFRERIARVHPEGSKSLSAIAAGGAARIAAATIASPLELARTSVQAGVGGESASVGSLLRKVRRRDGVMGLWRGLGPTLMRDAPFSAIYWSAYEMLKDPERSVLPAGVFQRGVGAGGSGGVGVYLASGIGAGGVAAICTVPPDVVKTRRQSWVVGGGRGGSSMDIAKRIVEEEGIRGLFRGAGPRVVKVAPACAVMMGSYELFRTLFGAEAN